MQFDALAVPALILFVITSTILALSLDWRVSLSALGAQYAGVFILVGSAWPLEMAVIKLVAGWIAAAVLGMELVSKPDEHLGKDPTLLSGSLFRIFLGVLVGLAILAFAPDLAKWMLHASYEQILGGIFLIGMGIFQLGLSDQPFRVAIGILSFTSGFEIIYATVETSPLVAGFFAVLTLGIALISSYLMAAPTLEVEG
jgi:hypothetical protein